MANPLSPIEGIVESILYVDDLATSIAFYREVLQLKPIAGDQIRFQTFQVGPRQVLILFLRGGTLQPVSLPGGTIPPHDGRGPHHLGFGISATAYDSWRQYLREKGVKIESEAVWPKGSHSLYFRDPDGHLLELVTPGIWPNY
ncbi:MAG: VOC family protein [Opitutaceae bacterium]|nr:VOC family protein [Opitutaceae bacterium]